MRIILSLMCATIILFVHMPDASAQNPFLKVENKTKHKTIDINNLEEAYIFFFDSTIEKYSILQKEMEDYNEFIDFKVSPKGEFEKQADYDNRVVKNDEKLKEDYYRVTHLESEFKQYYEFTSEIFGKWLWASYYKHIYDSLSIKSLVNQKMKDIGSYNSESEEFYLSFNENEFRLDISIELAEAFKNNYTSLNVYQFGVDCWTEYENEWYRLVDPNNTQQYEYEMNNEEGAKFVINLFETMKEFEKHPTLGLLLPDAFIPQPFKYNNLSVIEGREFKTIRFGNQMWLAENYYADNGNGDKNLRYYSKGETHYLDRELDSTLWKVPSKKEWEILVEFFENTNDANKRMYEFFPCSKKKGSSYEGSRSGEKIPTLYWSTSSKSSSETFGAYATPEKLDINAKAIRHKAAYQGTGDGQNRQMILLVRKY